MSENVKITSIFVGGTCFIIALMIYWTHKSETDAACVGYETITQVGQCTMGGHYGPRCAAKTNTGRKVINDDPYMIGDQVCITKEKVL